MFGINRIGTKVMQSIKVRLDYCPQVLRLSSDGTFSNHQYIKDTFRELVAIENHRKRLIDPILQLAASYLKLAGSRLNGNSASMASTEVAAGSSLKT